MIEIRVFVDSGDVFNFIAKGYNIKDNTLTIAKYSDNSRIIFFLDKVIYYAISEYLKEPEENDKSLRY